ncbi:transglutaminase-like cysteine peptidase [Pararhizobium antarcticum]|uniref:Uncharacterized protein n=1 Tax=Pararhizobium antarcticum TaxID=1798805 RepID=A0A657LZQ9_9HYPH|nr:transglutaminase-like cysteine peptidase [Pararhizobium antarcticum]OJF98452.1 hypothetical protein AX761_01565 [Rhizobium sp. 58]OJG01016.1 hypothetical protein AX760_09305 [Pararhizobium antarcticum]
MKTLFLGIIAAITFTVGMIAPSQAMSISSATRSIATAMPIQTAKFSDRAKISRQIFCLQLSTECRSGGKSVVAYTNKLRTVLTSVNRNINRVMPAIRAHREFLSFNPLPGPSEDYAMMKRTRLIKAGLPASALRLASVTRPSGRRHTVLIVATSNGDFVLDSRKQTVMKRHASDDSFASLTEVRFFD